MERISTMKSPSSAFGNRNLGVDLLAIIFGIGSWIGVNSMFLQFPLLVSSAPEGWSLPSYLVIIIQIANIGPIAYTLFQKFSAVKLNDTYVIYALYLVGLLATICMITLYKEVAFVAGEYRSVALFASAFGFAIVGCTSSVLFMPYMGRFKEIYLITYLVGEGLSGLLPSIFALIQGVGGNSVCMPSPTDPNDLVEFTPDPLFGTDVFFGIITILISISAIAFVLLNNLRFCKDEYAHVTIGEGNDYQYEDDRKQSERSTQSNNSTIADVPKVLSSRNYIFLMFVMAVVSMFGSGIFPSFQSYSCMPYGNTAYHFSVTLSLIANPLACLMAVFLPHKSIRQISVLSLVMAVITAYALATASLSPNPPLQGTQIGEALVVKIKTHLKQVKNHIKLMFFYYRSSAGLYLSDLSAI